MNNPTRDDVAGEPNKPSHVRDIVFIILVALAVGGVAVMDFSKDMGLWYWLAMAPVFAAASIFLAWHVNREALDPRPLLIKRQLVHWLIQVVAVLMTFLLLRFSDFTQITAGFVALLTLAMTTLLAGVHFEWRLAVLGLILVATFVAAVLAEHFFWLLLIVAVIAVIVALRWRGHTTEV